MSATAHVDTVTRRLRGAPKYRSVHPDTIADVVRQESRDASDRADLERRARLKLHLVYSAYLLSAPLTQLRRELDQVGPDDARRRAFCRTVLASHSSSAERMPELEGFYPTLLEATGPARTIADLACALNPFSLPWLRDVSDARYVGYDLNLAYIELGRAFLDRFDPDAELRHEDVLLDPGRVDADVALLLKTYHSIEERAKGAGLRLVAELGARTVVVSFPVRSLQGRRAPLWQRQADQLDALGDDRGWPVLRVSLRTEELVVIRKQVPHSSGGSVHVDRSDGSGDECGDDHPS